MMSTQKLSKYRQRLRQLLKEIDTLAYRSPHEDGLIRGTPGEVFRTCGKKSCKCASDLDDRHGPYLVIQIFRDGKQKQIALKKEQKAIWQKAKNYKLQMKYFLELKASMKKVEDLVKEIIDQRLEEWPP